MQRRARPERPDQATPRFRRHHREVPAVCEIARSPVARESDADSAFTFDYTDEIRSTRSLEGLPTGAVKVVRYDNTTALPFRPEDERVPSYDCTGSSDGKPSTPSGSISKEPLCSPSSNVKRTWPGVDARKAGPHDTSAWIDKHDRTLVAEHRVSLNGCPPSLVSLHLLLSKQKQLFEHGSNV